MPKLLVVDDALTDRVRVSGIAAQWMGCEIIEAENGREALELVETQLPDMILTDLQMPEMNGLDLVTAVKDDFPHIPVILMTAQGSEEIAAEALRRGATSYVPKLRLAEYLVSTLSQVYATAQVAHTQHRLMHYMSDSISTFALPNDLKIIRTCVDQLLNMLRCLPLGDESERLRVGIALQEALFNAYYHGNLEVTSKHDGDPDSISKIAAKRCRLEPWGLRKIHLQADISRKRARFVIRDEGDGFDAELIDGNDGSTVSDGIRGRGITMMKSVMDEVRFNSRGNEVTMIRNAVDLSVDDDEDFDDD